MTKFVELTGFDRCDLSRVEQARVLWTLPGSRGDSTGDPLTLMFCKHHSDMHATELDAQGWELIASNTEQLIKRAVGAEVS